MKKLYVLLLMVVLLLLAGCGKSEEVKETEWLIETVSSLSIKQVDDTTTQAIQAALAAYEALPQEEKSSVENYDTLKDISAQYSLLLKQRICSQEKVSVDDAYAFASTAPLGDEDWMAFVEKLRDMVACEGVFYQHSKYDDYIAEVTFYLQFGECWFDIDYEGYMGSIDENKLYTDGEDGFLFKATTEGFHINFLKQMMTPEFLFRFAPDHMYVEWGSSHYYLTRQRS